MFMFCVMSETFTLANGVGLDFVSYQKLTFSQKIGQPPLFKSSNYNLKAIYQ